MEASSDTYSDIVADAEHHQTRSVTAQTLDHSTWGYSYACRRYDKVARMVFKWDEWHTEKGQRVQQ